MRQINDQKKKGGGVKIFDVIRYLHENTLFKNIFLISPFKFNSRFLHFGVSKLGRKFICILTLLKIKTNSKNFKIIRFCPLFKFFPFFTPFLQESSVKNKFLFLLTFGATQHLHNTLPKDNHRLSKLKNQKFSSNVCFTL